MVGMGSADGQTLAALLLEQPRRQLKRGATLFHEGSPAIEAYFLHSGVVKLVKTATDGFQALVALSGPGGLVGAHSTIDGLPRLTRAVAVIDTSLTAVSRDRLLAVIREDPDLALDLLGRFSRQLRIALRHLMELASGDAVTLVARRLLELVSDPMFDPLRSVRGDTTSIEMPMSQQELASWAGISHRSMAGALQRLRDEGLISTSRLHLDVHDAAALALRCAAGPSLVTDQPRM